MMKLHQVLVVTTRADKVAEREITNGAVSRMLAWQTLIPSIRFLKPQMVDAYNSGDLCVVDLTGERLITCIKIWRQWRHTSPVCFLQDSQVRYNVSGLFNAFRLNRKCFFAVNALRGAIREAFCYFAFRAVGYVTANDFFMRGKSHEIRALTSSLVVAERNIQGPIRVQRLRMVGNFDYGPNRDGLLEIMNDAAVQEVISRRGLQVVLSGFGASEVASLLPASLVDFERCGAFEALGDLHDHAQILICPSLFGSGIKNKIIEGQVICNFTLAWRGFCVEYPYSPSWTDFFYSTVDLAEYIDFICARLGSEPFPQSFFALAEEYRFNRFLSHNLPDYLNEMDGGN